MKSIVRRDDYYKVGKFFRHKIFYWHLVYTAMLDCLKKFNFVMMDVLLLLLLLLSISFYSYYYYYYQLYCSTIAVFELSSV